MLVALFLRQVVMQANARCAAGVVYPPGFALGLSTEQPPNATTADWLATACSILPLDQVKILAKKYKSEVLITTLQNGHINKLIFGNFDAYWAQ